MTTPSPYAPEPTPAPSSVTPLLPAAAPAVPATTDNTSVLLAASIVVVAFVATVVNVIAGLNFPQNAPVEQAFCFGITVDLIAVAMTFAIRFLVIFRRPRALAPAWTTPGVLAILGAIFAVIAFIGWFPLGGAYFLEKITGLAGSGPSSGLRYYLDVAGFFFMGIPWVLGIVFGAIGYRKGRGVVNAVLSFGAVGLGALLLIPTLYSAVMYGLGLSS